jgi:hypothetical protein
MELGSLHEQYQIKIRNAPKSYFKFPVLPGESEQCARMRQDLYNQESERLKEMVDSILEKNNQECVESVVSFLPFEDHALIPTAIVVGGHSGSDRSIFYNQLLKTIPQPVCILDSAIDTLKECIRRINDEFVGKSNDCEFDIQKLVSWYQSTGSNDRLVICIPDFEGFSSAVLQSLIRICHVRRQELPISLVLGVATNRDVVHQSISKASFSCLNTRLFKLTHTRVCLGQIVTEYFLNHHGMKLGYMPFRALMDRFLERDLSIQSFVRGIQYALMAHYFGNPLSVFLHPKMATTPFEDLHLDHLLVLPSFQSHIELMHDRAVRALKKQKRSGTEWEESKQDIQEVHELLRDMDTLEEFARQQVSKLRQYNQRFSIALGLLHKIPSLFKSNEVKKSIFYLYEVGLSEEIMDNEYVRMWLTLFRKLDAKPIHSYLDTMLHTMKQHEDLFHKDIPVLQGILKKVEQEMEDESESESESDEEEYIIKYGLKRVQVDMKTSRKTKVAKKAGTHMLEGTRSPEKNPLLDQISTFLKRFFSMCLIQYDLIPLHEVWYFVDPQHLVSKVLFVDVDVSCGTTGHVVYSPGSTTYLFAMRVL